MKVSRFAVFYIWTNIYTVTTGFLTQPYIMIYKQRHTQNPFSLGRTLSIGAGKKYSLANRHLRKNMKEKRFFEFSPLAFERQNFRKPGDESFIFDSKRFFQYSPFISRLQRSHAHRKLKIKSPKNTHKPYVFKPVVDHFSGLQTWPPPSESSVSSKILPHPLFGWSVNRNKELELGDNFVNNRQTSVLENLGEPHSISENQKDIGKIFKPNSEVQTALHLLNEKGHKSELLLDSHRSDQMSLEPSKENLENSLISKNHYKNKLSEFDFANNKPEHKLEEVLGFDGGHHLPKIEDIGGRNNMHTENDERISFFSEPSGLHESQQGDEFHADKPFGSWDNHALDSDFSSDRIFPQQSGHAPVDTFGSFTDIVQEPHGEGSFGLGDLVSETETLDSDHKNSDSFGFWGPIKDDINLDSFDDDGITSDAIPIPSFGSTDHGQVSILISLNILLYIYLKKHELTLQMCFRYSSFY